MQAGDQATGLEARVSLGRAGRSRVSTGVPLLDHLLELMATRARFELQLDVAPGRADAAASAAGSAVGEALRPLLRAEDATGHGYAIAPADEALANVVLETSERPRLVTNVDLSDAHVAGLERDLVSEFLRELTDSAGLTLHVRLLHGEDARNVLEAIFKALGGALAAAGAPGKERP